MLTKKLHWAMLAVAVAFVMMRHAGGRHYDESSSSSSSSSSDEELAMTQPDDPDSPEGPIAITYDGTMKGSVMISRLGRQFYAFRGIPYAEPPVGNLRFRAPVPRSPWEGVLDASADREMCIQKNYLLSVPSITGQEDCLFLNVYTPKVSPPYGLLPVMVYIHGGGFFSGTGASSLVGPQHLLDKDIVLVTLNYRLGVFGFLSTGTADAPGNAGFKDQVEVLRWVNKNIAIFGGDPQCVTIFGQSAGGASVHLHMLSPLSRGLFHRAITESGTALNAWAKPVDPWPIATRQASLVNCTGTTPEEIVSCLRNTDATELVNSGDAFHVWSIDPLTTYRPVVEQGENAFLTDEPIRLIHAGSFEHVPWMSGVVSGEGIIRAVPILTNETLLNDINRQPNELLPFLMELPRSVATDDVADVWRNISNHYFGTDNVTIGEANQQKFIDLYTDRSMLEGFYKSAVLHSRVGHHDQYLYYFNYRGLYSYTPLFAQTTTNYGVSHCDELIYLFSTPLFFPPWEANHPDLQVIDNLVTLWTNFAKFGRPTPATVGGPYSAENTADNTTCAISCTGPQNTVWEPYEPQQCSEPESQLKYLNISAQIDGTATLKFCMEKGLLPDRVGFWESLPLQENREPYYIEYIAPVNQLLYYTTGLLLCTLPVQWAMKHVEQFEKPTFGSWL